jgi:hypothetical protein
VGLALLGAQTLIALPLVKAHPTTELLGGELATLPLGQWIFLAMPAAAALVTALGVALLRWTIALPTLRFCADMRQSAAIDAAFRRESALALLFQGAQLLFFLTMTQWLTILDNVSRANFDRFSLTVMPLFYVIVVGYFVVLLKMALLQGAHLTGAHHHARAT